MVIIFCQLRLCRGHLQSHAPGGIGLSSDIASLTRVDWEAGQPSRFVLEMSADFYRICIQNMHIIILVY